MFLSSKTKREKRKQKCYKLLSVIRILNNLQWFLSQRRSELLQLWQSFLNGCYTERNYDWIICTPRETPTCLTPPILDLFTMMLLTKLLALARVIHDSSSPLILFCRLTFTPLIESVLYKIWTQARRSPFLNLFHAALYLSLGPLSSHFSVLYTIISYQILCSLQHTVSYASKQEKKMPAKKGRGAKFILLSAFSRVKSLMDGEWKWKAGEFSSFLPLSLSTLGTEAHVNWLRRER